MSNETDRPKEFWTLGEIAQRWGCSHSTVLTHVNRGDLRAVDISTNRRGKSRYIVSTAVLEAFEEARQTPPPEEAPPRRKKVRVRAGDVIEFFPANG